MYCESDSGCSIVCILKWKLNYGLKVIFFWFTSSKTNGRSNPYEVDISNSFSSASSQATSDVKAIPASCTTLAFFWASELLARSWRNLVRFLRSDKISKGTTASKRSCRQNYWINDLINSPMIHLPPKTIPFLSASYNHSPKLLPICLLTTDHYI